MGKARVGNLGPTEAKYAEIPPSIESFHPVVVDLRVVEIPRPPEQIAPRQIREIRNSLNASQPLFALLLNVSPKAVQSWEQGLRRPRAAALKLLAIAKRNPQVLLQR